MKSLKAYVYLFSFLFVLIFSFGFAIAQADDHFPAIPNRAPASYFIGNSAPKDLNLDYLANPEELLVNQKQIRTEEFIPLSLPETTNDGRLIAGKVLRHSLQNWIEASDRDHSLLHQSIHRANSQLNTNVALFPTSTQHRFRLRFKAAQGIGILRYQGFFDANFSYYAFEQTSNLEVIHLWQGKTYYIDRSENYLGNVSMAGIRWGF